MPGRPAADAEHAVYSKREMARDCVALLEHLGHDRFAVVGHDRGARVTARLADDLAALLGQHALPADAARLVGEKLSLDEDAVLLLQMIPLRGSIDDRVPTDPTIYRFYEILQVYGSTLKVLVHEKFGDGIISAINFKLDVKKVADPEGGERAVITLDGKYLPTKPF